MTASWVHAEVPFGAGRGSVRADVRCRCYGAGRSQARLRIQNSARMEVSSHWEVDIDGRRVSELTRAGWPLLLVVMTALAPEPADPNPVPTLVDSAVFVAVMAGLVGTVVAAVARQSKALVWSTGLGMVWVATTITCPLSGHHDAVGWQWYAELAFSSSLLLFSLAGIGLLLRPRLSEELS
jgi:hypothetical protein